MTHLALRFDGMILAHFINWADAAEFCKTYDALHLPFNSNHHETPKVGSFHTGQ
jgi:hypothetical protein